MLLGQSRGKVGELVFARRLGQQIVRPHIASISNPKTSAQAYQRMTGIAPLTKFYSAFSEPLERSFEGLRKGPSFSAFLKANSKVLRNGPWLPKGSDWAPAPYQVSRGTLQELSYSVSDEHIDLSSFVFTRAENESGVFDTLGSFSSWLIGKYPEFQDHDQITFLFAILDDEGVLQPFWVRWFLDTSSNENFQDLINALLIGWGIEFGITTDPNGYSTVTMDAPSFGQFAGFAAIHSRYDEQNATWLRSTQTMAVSDVLANMYTQEAYNTALQSYMTTAAGTPESSVYLNGESTAIEASSLIQLPQPLGFLSAAGTRITVRQARLVTVTSGSNTYKYWIFRDNNNKAVYYRLKLNKADGIPFWYIDPSATTGQQVKFVSEDDYPQQILDAYDIQIALSYPQADTAATRAALAAMGLDNSQITQLLGYVSSGS